MPFRSVLVLTPNRFYGEMLCQAVHAILPDARCGVAGTIPSAEERLKVAPVDLLLSCAPSDASGPSWLARISREIERARKILIVTSRREPGLIDALRRLPIGGVFDTATDGMENFLTALREVERGCTYWSKSVLETIHQDCLSPFAPLRRLTPTERSVFAVLADGRDDKSASAMLGLRPSTVSSVRRAIHRKLNVRHRGELMRLGMLYGFTSAFQSDVSQ